jgi:homoserine kinase
LLTGMTGISLHMQWPLTSQLHGSVSQREQLFFFCYGSNSAPKTASQSHSVLHVANCVCQKIKELKGKVKILYMKTLQLSQGLFESGCSAIPGSTGRRCATTWARPSPPCTTSTR